jgi:hypothetical protein
MAKNSANKTNAQSRGIIREIFKEMNLLTIYRGRAATHTSKAEKRRSRSSDRKKAINESED